MKVVKRVTISGATCLFLSTFIFFSTASATTDIEDFMGEGLSYSSISKENRSYRSDNSIPSAEELMGEGIQHPQADLKRKYSYDSSTPSAPEMMSEGLVLRDQSEQIEPTLDVAVQ